MWYHKIYVLLILVLYALVISIMLLSRYTTVQTIYQRTNENYTPMSQKFILDQGPPFTIVENLTLREGDRVRIGTSSVNGANYTVAFILGATGAPTIEYSDPLVALNGRPRVTLTAPRDRADYAIRYTNGNNVILEFIEVYSYLRTMQWLD